MKPDKLSKNYLIILYKFNCNNFDIDCCIVDCHCNCYFDCHCFVDIDCIDCIHCLKCCNCAHLME